MTAITGQFNTPPYTIPTLGFARGVMMSYTGGMLTNQTCPLRGV
jgi:hypothetical protein